MTFDDVYCASDNEFLKHCGILYDLMKERKPEESISHKQMPSLKQHCEFVRSRPYKEWRLIKVEEDYVGCIYLTHMNEIGVSIFNEHRRQGHGRQAVLMLMEMNKGGRMLANINPLNTKSIKLFAELGFRKIQETYCLE